MGTQDHIEQSMAKLIADNKAQQISQQAAQNKTESDFDLAFDHFQHVCVDVVTALKRSGVPTVPIAGKTNRRLIGAYSNDHYGATLLENGWKIGDEFSGRYALGQSGDLYVRDRSSGSASTHEQALWIPNVKPIKGKYLLKYQTVPDYIRVSRGGKYIGKKDELRWALSWIVSNTTISLKVQSDIELVGSRPFFESSDRDQIAESTTYRSVEGELIQQCAMMIAKKQGKI